ncbi:hypothetical protein KIPB_012839, partial [Kipferlia bialata]
YMAEQAQFEAELKAAKARYSDCVSENTEAVTALRKVMERRRDIGTMYKAQNESVGMGWGRGQREETSFAAEANTLKKSIVQQEAQLQGLVQEINSLRSRSFDVYTVDGADVNYQ